MNVDASYLKTSSQVKYFIKEKCHEMRNILLIFPFLRLRTIKKKYKQYLFNKCSV